MNNQTIQGMQELVACDYRLSFLNGGQSRCRHPRVHVAEGLISPQVCAACQWRECSASQQQQRSEADSSSHDEQIRCDVVIPYCPANLRWLQVSIESILNQVGATCIVHLIADGFEDSKDPVREFAKHSQVRLYRNSETIGPYRSVNRIASRLETPYLAIQDSDDIALPHRLAHSIQQLRKESAEMFGAAMQQFVSYESRDHTSIERVRKQPVHRSGRHKWSVSPDGVIINGTRVLTVDLFRRMNGFASLFMSADCEFTTRCLKAGASVVFSDEIVALRRVHSDSLSYGKLHGMGSTTREASHERIVASYRLMKPGFDPRQFGGLAADLKLARLTPRIEESYRPRKCGCAQSRLG